MTSVRIFNEVAGRDSTVNVPLSLSDVTTRLRNAIGEGDYDIYGCTVSIYARIVGGTVNVFLYGCGSEEATAEFNRIKSALIRERKVTA